MNSSDPVIPLIVEPPFYYTARPSVVPGFRDTYLSLVTPFIAYWSLSLFFQLLDSSDWKWLEKYRIHPSAEVSSRNLVTKGVVLRTVLLQQLVQTLLGLWWMDDRSATTPEVYVADMRSLSRVLARGVAWMLGTVEGEKFLQANGAGLVYFMYWWAIPAAQLIFAMFVMDTWQYFLHRSMHLNKWLYKHIHSVHHRLYVPYAYGALYNHPIEGFLLDSLGAAISEAASFMTVRQATFLFGISVLKTVDDHCGYRLPFDPFFLSSKNNADYHDIHHQVIGIKSNFAQPFFVHWDAILGTRLTRGDIQARRLHAKAD